MTGPKLFKQCLWATIIASTALAAYCLFNGDWGWGLISIAMSAINLVSVSRLPNENDDD